MAILQVYVSEADKETVAKAKELAEAAGTSMSAVVMERLRDWVRWQTMPLPERAKEAQERVLAFLHSVGEAHETEIAEKTGFDRDMVRQALGALGKAPSRVVSDLRRSGYWRVGTYASI